MFLRTYEVIRTRALDQLDQLVEQFPTKVGERLGNSTAVNTLKEQMSVDLTYEPPKPPPDLSPHPTANSLNWTTFKQRYAFHASGGFSAGIPTVRAPKDFRIVDGIHIALNVNPRSVSLTVESYDPRSKYVIGPVDASASNEDQQQFLLDRGWQPIAPKIVTWRPLFRNAIREDLRSLIEELKGEL